MDNKRFQELVLKKLDKLDKLDKKQDDFDKRLHNFDERLHNFDEKLVNFGNKLDFLDKRQSNTECDTKVMLKLMEELGEGQKRLEKLVAPSSERKQPATFNLPFKKRAYGRGTKAGRD